MKGLPLSGGLDCAVTPDNHSSRTSFAGRLRSGAKLMRKIAMPLMLLAALMASASAMAGDIGYASPEAALTALRAMPDTTVREENDWFVVYDKANTTVWSITSEKHPAHPTAVKRALVTRDGAVSVEMNVMCGVQKDVCDDVVEQFQRINDGLRQRMQH